MKSIKKLLLLSLFIVGLIGCSGVKVLDSWKGENAATLKSKNTLVIARTNNQQARIAFEEAIANKLRAAGVPATESYKKIPTLNVEKKLTEADVAEAKRKIEAAGYHGVVISVMKDKKLTVQRNSDGGYYAGATYGVTEPFYSASFYGYYAYPGSYYMQYGGNYVPETVTTQESVTYVLETLFYNLDEPEEKQLLAVVTSSLEDPEGASATAKIYANKIASALK
ncbi:hypothetical protein [Aureitalea marina]|uniref:DUF4136 domain-containing protein n=1 Tax=Aureitalea marina TaxID=930804 RepID=A0A2S7KSK2_9FLAO|nr:hypothetical protein [Aureitalea marina]PQB05587.1 hypothetical protein BST85_12275 [Aureitalea marina]